MEFRDARCQGPPQVPGVGYGISGIYITEKGIEGKVKV